MPRLPEKIIVPLIFLASLILGYYGLWRYHYPVPPGDDSFVHLLNIHSILVNGTYKLGDGYPPGLYYIVILFHNLSGWSVVDSLKFMAPAFIPLCGISLWLFTRVVFEKRAALMAYLFFTFVSTQPLQTYYDGSFPNLLAAGILLPLLFMSIFQLIRVGQAPKHKWRWRILTGLLLIAVPITHHLTVIILMAVLLPWLLIYGLDKLIASHNQRILIGGIIAIPVSLLIIFWLFFHLEMLKPAATVFDQYIGFAAHYPFIIAKYPYFRTPWNGVSFSKAIGGAIYQLGWLGLLIFTWQSWRGLRKEGRAVEAEKVGLYNYRLGGLLIAIWFLVYYYGATHSWSGEPTRLGRDLAMPSSILAGIGAVWAFDRLNKSWRPLAMIFVVALLVTSFFNFQTKYHLYTDHAGMVRFSAADEQAYQYLLENNLSRTTMILPRENSWSSLVVLRGTEADFPQLSYDQPLSVSLALSKEKGWNTPCFLTGWYMPSVWPPEYSEKSYANTYLNSSDYTFVHYFSDPNKEWYLVCRK